MLPVMTNGHEVLADEARYNRIVGMHVNHAVHIFPDLIDRRVDGRFHPELSVYHHLLSCDRHSTMSPGVTSAATVPWDG